MTTATASPRKPRTFNVPEPIDRALKTAAEKVETVATETKQVAAKVESKVRDAAEKVKETGAEIRKDPKGFVSGVVRDGRHRAEKVGGDISREATRLADDVSKRVNKTVETAIMKTLHRFNVPTHQDLKNLTQKVDALGKKIDTLAKARAAKKPSTAKARTAKR